MQIISHPSSVAHEVSPGHPERPERIEHLYQNLDQTGISQTYPIVQATAVNANVVELAHPGHYLANLEAHSPAEGLINLDADTCMGPNSLSAAIYAAGAVCNGVTNALSGAHLRNFCLVRPPGHHAESDAAMGFCLLNSIAIGTYHALQHPDVSRVAILDFDVHHGNGTVDIFRDVPEVLVCSSFQHPFYPHRFYDSDWSNIINTPLAEGSGGSAFRAAIEAQWLPAIEAHKPDIIMVSAGFDGHADDLLAGLNLVEGDFTWVTQLIVSVANQYAKGRIVSTLEGGYDLGALAGSVEAHLTALA